MRIIFLCLGNEFTQSMYYKENWFIKAAVERGDEVLVVANLTTYIDGVSSTVDTGATQEDGYKLIRLSPQFLLCKTLTSKIRWTRNLLGYILGFKPDLIFYNCPQIWNINELPTIKKELPNCKIVWDFSTWYGNSGSNWISLNVLHRGIYRRWLKRNQQYVDKICYISSDAYKFITEVYQLDTSKMELNDLPGMIQTKESLMVAKQDIANQYHLGYENIIMAHSGKMDYRKKTLELLKAFSCVPDKNFRLFILGSFDKAIEQECIKKIEHDSRVIYLGFVSGDTLLKVLCACDIYLQPGSTSQTLQDAICCGCVPMYANRQYDVELIGTSGWMVESEQDIVEALEEISSDRQKLKQMSNEILEIAKERLDYKRLYAKIWE